MTRDPDTAELALKFQQDVAADPERVVTQITNGALVLAALALVVGVVLGGLAVWMVLR